MASDLSCDLARDLLPSYADGLLSDASKAAVEAHLAQCEDCRRALDAMLAPMEPLPVDTPEVRYLKRFRTRHRRLAAMAAVLAVSLATLLVIMLPTFFTNRAKPAYLMWYDMGMTGRAGEEPYRVVRFESHLIRSYVDYIQVEETGEPNVYTVSVLLRGMPLVSRSLPSVHVLPLYDLPSDATLMLDGTYAILDKGAFVEKGAAELRVKADAFVPTKECAEDLIRYLGINLLTWGGAEVQAVSRETLSLRLFGEPDANLVKTLPENLRDTAFLLLAALTPLREVEVTYDDGGKEKTQTFTYLDALSALGMDYKNEAQTPSGLQKALDALAFDRLLIEGY